MVNSPWWLIVILMALIGLGCLIPVTSRLELLKKMMSNLKSGLTYPIFQKRWTDPLYPLLHKIPLLNNFNQDASDLREGWMDQIAQSAAQEERNRLAREFQDSIK